MSEPTPPRATVLVVEDEMVVARDLQEMLTAMGYRVPDVAGSAEEALYLAELHEPDLVLIDIVLRGDRDGVALARTLREERAAALVFVTSHADPGTVKRASSARPNGYLVKPFTPEAVLAAAETALANYAEEQRTLHLTPEPAATDDALAPEVVERVERFVDRHFARPITLGDMADHVGLSPFHFARQFKAATGVPPYRYVVAQRLDEAKRLLRNTDWPVLRVADAVGYESASHFSALFKRETGVTPGQYRALT
ncbi:MAG: response regulator transcription factor [Bacteroidota bacterium]